MLSLTLLLLSSCSFVAWAQSAPPLTFDPAQWCVPNSGITLKTCNEFFALEDKCNAQAALPTYTACVCNQAYFDGIINCKSDFRRCIGDTSWDSTLDIYLDLFHGYCDPSASITSFKPTTPVLATTRFDGQALSSALITSSAFLPSATVTVSKAGDSVKTTSSSAGGYHFGLNPTLAAGLGVVPVLLLGLRV